MNRRKFLKGMCLAGVGGVLGYSVLRNEKKADPYHPVIFGVDWGDADMAGAIAYSKDGIIFSNRLKPDTRYLRAEFMVRAIKPTGQLLIS